MSRDSTPGPWRRHYLAITAEAHAVGGGHYHHTLAQVKNFRDLDEAAANATLMAAAPDFKKAALDAIKTGRQCSASEIAISKSAWLALRDALAKLEDEE